MICNIRCQDIGKYTQGLEMAFGHLDVKGVLGFLGFMGFRSEQITPTTDTRTGKAPLERKFKSFSSHFS